MINNVQHFPFVKKFLMGFVIFSTICLTMITSNSFAGSVRNLSTDEPKETVKGIVVNSESGSPLIGAHIYVDNKSIRAITDENGEFEILLNRGKNLISISSLGYKTFTQNIQINSSNKNVLKFKLKPEAISISEVYVVAKSEARKLKESAMPATVINMQQLAGTVSSVEDVLAKTVGVTVRSTGGVGSASRLSVRGLEGKRIGFFIDGRPMNEHSEFVDINDVPVELIDRIEIYKGVVPAKFGGSAIGGAVNIVSKEYPARYLDMSYTLESYNTHKASTVFQRNNNDTGIVYGFGGFYTYSDNDYEMKLLHRDGEVVKRDHDAFSKLTIAGTFEAHKWWFDKVIFEPMYIRSFKEIQGIEYNVQHAQNSSDAFVLINALERDNFLIEGLDFSSDITLGYAVSNMADTSMVRYNWDGTTFPANSQYGGETQQWASLAENKKSVFSQQLFMSYVVDNNHSVTFSSFLNYAYNQPQDIMKDKVIGWQTNFDSRLFSWVAGVGYDFRTNNDKFFNSLNVKYYTYSTSTKMADILNAVSDVDLQKQDFGISNALRYRFTPELMGKFSVSYDVRLPSETELLGDGYYVSPSATLIPERNKSLNLGLLFDQSGKNRYNTQVELNIFYSHLENMIRFVGGSIISQYQNFGEARTLGAEFEVKTDLTKWLYGYGNVTYQDLRDVRVYEPNSSVLNPTNGMRIPNVPYLMANVGLEFHKRNLFGGKENNSRIYCDVSFVEEYFYDFEMSQYQSRRIPRSFVVDFGAEYSFKSGRYIVMAKFNNLTDADVVSEFNHPLPGRTFSLRLRYVLK